MVANTSKRWSSTTPKRVLVFTCMQGRKLVMPKRQSAVPNMFKASGDHLSSQVGEHTLMYANVCMRENLYVTGMHVDYTYSWCITRESRHESSNNLPLKPHSRSRLVNLWKRVLIHTSQWDLSSEASSSSKLSKSWFC